MKAIIKSLYQNSINKKVKSLILNAFSEDHNIRSYVGFNSNTPISVLEFLSNDESWIVREWTACNVIIPIHILEKLSKDKDYRVRSKIAKSNTTPIHILEKLSKDKSIYVCEWVRRNPKWKNRN